ncbi:PLCD4 isoform 14, partial [Pan troglodytes]
MASLLQDQLTTDQDLLLMQEGMPMHKSQSLMWRQYVMAMIPSCCVAWQRSSPWSRASPLSSMAAAPTWTW